MQFVQNKYFDRPQALYPGQLADYASNTLAQGVRSYATAEQIIFGRGVVKGTPYVNDFVEPAGHIQTPYPVRMPVASGTPSVEADFVGIAVLPLGAMGPASGDGAPRTNSLRPETMIPVAERYSGVIIAVEIPASVTIVDGGAVYLVLADGTFHNASGAGRILIPDLVWYGNPTAPAAVTGVAPLVGRIKMSARGPQGPQGEPG